MGTIMIVDDEGRMRAMLALALDAYGHHISEAESAESAQRRIPQEKPDIVIADVRMNGMSGLDLLKWIKKQYPDIEVIIMTAFADAKTGIEAMRNGALKYVCKPFEIDEILQSISHGLAKNKLTKETAAPAGLFGDRFTLDALSGRSAAMQATVQRAKIVACRDTTVLIRGKSGTGKELIARGIHRESGRKSFVPVNCAAIPEPLLESELFGHEKGAFTGAHERKIGFFERAGDGTIFLDEIGDLPHNLQVKLLRVLQEREFNRIGSTQIIAARSRVIAATNRNLEEAVASGKFREDLLFRLNVFPILVPSLSERLEDIPMLTNHFLLKYHHTAGFEDDIPQYLSAYDWPGNVRELENCIEYAVILASGEKISGTHLPEHIARVKRTDPAKPGAGEAPPFPENEFSLEEMEKRLIIKALKKAEGNKSEAARLLGITRRALYSKMKVHGIDKEG